MAQCLTEDIGPLMANVSFIEFAIKRTLTGFLRCNEVGNMEAVLHWSKQAGPPDLTVFIMGKND